MNKVAHFVGLDVHKKSIVYACADATSQSVGEAVSLASDATVLMSHLERLGSKETLLVGYESGPTGYWLCRALRDAGYSCVVMAATTIPSAAGDKIKTDRRDARKLARVLRSGDFSAVEVPSVETEAIRDLTRLREDLKAAERVAQQQLQGFLLRIGRVYSQKHWTAKHVAWIEATKFEHPVQQMTCLRYLEQVRARTSEIAAVDQQLETVVDAWSYRDVVRALMAFRGIRLLTAVTVLAELGDLTRFRTAPALMAYLGLVPSEHSSGGTRRQGHLTKTGNGHVRRVLVEASWAYRFRPKQGGAIGKRASATSPDVQRIAMKAQERLHSRYRKLTARGVSKPKVVVSIARELAGFLWAIGQLEEFSKAPAAAA